VIWFGGFTYDFHDNIQLFVPFVEAYLTNSFIYNIGVYSFKIKNITKFQAFRGFLFVCFWHYVDYQVCLPILKWIVYVLDKKVDYESMGWVYKLEAYLDAKGWIPRHPWSTYTKKKKYSSMGFFFRSATSWSRAKSTWLGQNAWKFVFWFRKVVRLKS